jgi:CubicO group peptidase (beta-lactamase class C family)
MLASTEHALLHRLATEQRRGRAPSLVGAVVRDGEVAFAAGRGDVADVSDTQYRIGSITKTLVAVLIMRLRDGGCLDLADRLEVHLPATPFGDRTIGQLLSASGGLTSEAPGQWWERVPGHAWPELAAGLSAADVKHRASARFHYSNLGFGVLGELAARLRGRPWLESVRQEILEPLGMRRTTARPKPPHAQGYAVHPYADLLLPEPEHDAGGMAPAGQLWSTLSDLARWTSFLGGDTAEVVCPDTLAEMRTPVVVADGESWTAGYGLGLALMRDRGRRLVGHTGSMPGFLGATMIEPEQATGALVLTNTTAGVGVGQVVADLIDIAATREPRIGQAWQPSSEVDPALLELTGPWYWGPAPYVLRVEAGGWLSLAPAAGGGWRAGVPVPAGQRGHLRRPGRLLRRRDTHRAPRRRSAPGALEPRHVRVHPGAVRPGRAGARRRRSRRVAGLGDEGGVSIDRAGWRGRSGTTPESTIEVAHAVNGGRRPGNIGKCFTLRVASSSPCSSAVAATT